MSEVEWMQIFGRNLLDIMSDRGYPQTVLAEELGVTKGTISKYIKGLTMPSVKTLLNIAYILDCDVGELIDFGDIIE